MFLRFNSSQICGCVSKRIFLHSSAGIASKNFDNSFSDLADRFRKLGLDDNLVKPSYVINVGILQAKIQERIKQDPDLNYNYENEQFLSNIIREANLMMEEKDA